MDPRKIVPATQGTGSLVGLSVLAKNPFLAPVSAGHDRTSSQFCYYPCCLQENFFLNVEMLPWILLKNGKIKEFMCILFTISGTFIRKELGFLNSVPLDL